VKQYLGLGLGMLAGTLIGAAAVSGLHAQAKPPVYLVTEIDVTNPDAYAKEFAPKAQATIKAAGGRFIAIGGVAGVGAKPVTALQGTPPKRITIQAWDSYDGWVQWGRLSSSAQNRRKVCDVPPICDRGSIDAANAGMKGAAQPGRPLL
jgi:uncharacterized protein (DUF1330 family)